MQTKPLLGVFSGIPIDQRRRVYWALLVRKLIQGFVDDKGSCGCPLTVAASAVANEPLRVLSEINYREPIIAHRLGITEQDVRSFIAIWDRAGWLNRMAFKFAILGELANLSFCEALASLTARGLVPVHFRRYHV